MYWHRPIYKHISHISVASSKQEVILIQLLQKSYDPEISVYFGTTGKSLIYLKHL